MVNSILLIPSDSTLLSNVGMENKEIRRANLLMLMKEFGTARALAEAIGTDVTYVRNIKNRAATNGRVFQMGDEVARRIEELLHKPPGWMDVLQDKKVAQPDGRYNISAGPEVRGTVPLISWIQAGAFEEPADNYQVGEVEDWFPMPKRAGPHTYCLRVEGDSMTAPHGKSYPAGAIIFVDPDQRSPANGARIIAKLEGSNEVTLKVFVQEAGRAFLRPLNPQYPPIFDPFKILGTVIGKWEDD